MKCSPHMDVLLCCTTQVEQQILAHSGSRALEDNLLFWILGDVSEVRLLTEFVLTSKAKNRSQKHLNSRVLWKKRCLCSHCSQFLLWSQFASKCGLSQTPAWPCPTAVTSNRIWAGWVKFPAGAVLVSAQQLIFSTSKSLHLLVKSRNCSAQGKDLDRTRARTFFEVRDLSEVRKTTELHGFCTWLITKAGAQLQQTVCHLWQQVFLFPYFIAQSSSS